MDMHPTTSLKIHPLGEAAFTVTIGEAISLAASARLLVLKRTILSAGLPGVCEVFPAYTSLLVRFDPDCSDPKSLYDALTDLCFSAPASDSAAGNLVEVPVVYGGVFGPDLEDVAANAGITAGEVIHLHAVSEYTVAFLGFVPGFPYLIGLDPRLACARLANPRQMVSAGSVGIAGGQTGIYPLDSPGGWRIIGRTSLKFFDPEAVPPTLLKPGDRVRFIPVREGEAL
jgi:KipI family sensor histidine kinase inhibitor